MAEWTRKPPGAAGWYWFRTAPGQRAAVVEVEYDPHWHLFYRPVEYHGCRLFAHLPDFGEWQGPLAPDEGEVGSGD